MSRPTPPGPPPAPYKGLVPYTDQDAALFFGRDAERSIIIANLRASRFTLLYGPSGVGKSSVVGAGVVHALRERARQSLSKRGTPEFAVVYFNQWRDDPLAGLLRAVRTAVESLLGQTFPEDAAGTLDDRLKAWAERVGGDLLIILDQFEDYFLYHPLEDGPGTFAYEFPLVVTDVSARVNFMISIREDAIAKLDRFEGRIPTLFDNYIRVDHLDRASARDAIVKPIEQYVKRVGDPALKVTIEPELVEAVLDQVKTGRVSLTETGGGRIKGAADDETQEDGSRIETPFLQLVMIRLWEEELKSGSRVLRLETLKRLGGAERIVRTHLDNTLGGLPARERAAAAGVFHYLVTPSGTKIAHTARDLAEYTGTSEKQLTPVLEKMAASGMRILRPVAPPPDQLNAPTRYEIFHDVLAPAMLDWRRRYLQQRRNRFLYAGLGAVALVLLVAVGGLFLNLQRSQQQLAQKAQEAQDLSQAILAAPAATGGATSPPTLVALRATAAAVGTSSARVTCQGGPAIDFRASAASVAPGAAVTLEWSNAQRVSDVSIAPGVGTVETQGSKVVQAAQTTVYTLTATGCGGTTTRSVTVNVVAPSAAAAPATSSPVVVPTATVAASPTARPTAAPRSPTPRPTATAEPVNAPPAVYMTGMSVNPAEPRAGEPVVFTVAFLNTTGSTQRYNWCVDIFLPDDFPRKSFGNTTCTEQDIPAGASELPAQTWSVSRIGNCVQYLARAAYIDPSGARLPLVKPDNGQNWIDFTLCP